MSGGGATTAGVVIGEAPRMFLPKGDSVTLKTWRGDDETLSWDDTMFWNVYYVKGAFLDSDKAYEVLTGLKTYEMRTIQKAVNTITLASVLDQHPRINVNCPALNDHPNHELMRTHMRMGLPAGLFTIDFEEKGGHPGIDPSAFKKFFDNLEPAVGLQVSLGQTNTLALCPGLTSHSELSREAQREAGISPTTVRISVGLEDPRRLLAHLVEASQHALDPNYSGFSDGFPKGPEIDRIYRETYIDVHDRFLKAQPTFEAFLR